MQQHIDGPGQGLIRYRFIISSFFLRPMITIVISRIGGRGWGGGGGG